MAKECSTTKSEILASNFEETELSKKQSEPV